MRHVLKMVAVAALLAAMLISAPLALAQEEEPSVKFCVLHNPNNPHFIAVDEEGLVEHIEHGDVLFFPEPPTGCPEEPIEV